MSQYNPKPYEFVPIILWKNNDTLFNIFKNKFNIVDTFSLKFNDTEIKEKVKRLYYPHKIGDKDPRIKAHNILIIVLKIVEPEYMIYSRNEHKNKPLNKTIIKLKEELRKKYDASYFHSADYLNESQEVFKIFNINKYVSNELFINISELRGVIWLDGRMGPFTEDQNKHTGEYCLKKITDTPHYLYLKNNKKFYINYTKIDIGHNQNKYDKLIQDINSNKFCNENINKITIPVIYDTHINKYIIKDGLHRTSIYLNNNIQYIRCNLINNNSFTLNKRYIHEHYLDLELTIKELNIHKIRYVIIRGFKKLPLTPDTDLDIICHPADLNKLKNIMLKRLYLMNENKIIINSENVNYIQFKTKHIPNKEINNTYFHIDIYDNIFFFYKEKICLSNLLDKIFNNRILYLKNLYIPTPEFEYFLLLLRICFDVGKLHNKHKNRIIELIPHVKNNNNLFDYLNNEQKKFLLLKLKQLNVPISINYPKI